MNIGIDFDGVLFDTENEYRALSRIYNLKFDKKIVDIEQLRFQDRFDWTNKQVQKFIKDNLLNIQLGAVVMPCAKQVLKLLSKNHKIYAITSRGNSDIREIDISNKRLKEENIQFEDVVYSASNKLKVCQDLKIDIMIDDLLKTIKNLAENNIKCFYYRDNIVNDYTHPNVTIVRDWGDICAEMVKMGLISIDDIGF